VRRDYPDVVYKTEEAKLNAIVEDRDRLAASTSMESG
jgi:preprotein translocase subunit SecA